MRFANVEMIHLFWAVCGMAVFLFWRRHKKILVREKFVEKKLLPEIAASLESCREVQKIILLILAGGFCVLALMRPQWGFEWQEIKRQGLDILVAIDTSKSMLTDDVKPNRLERSKLAVKDLVKKLHGDRIGLIAFSGSGFLVCPLTVDYNGFLLTLDDVSTDTIPQGGTCLASAVREAIKSYKDAPGKYKAMIIITDGEDLEGGVEKVAKEALGEGVKIFCIGIGTKKGELIRVKNRLGEHEFLKDKSGNFVKSRLNEKLLEEIAIITGGAYIHASGARFGLDLIYDQRLSKMEKHEIETKMEKRYYERFQIPLAIAFVLLCWETLLAVRKKI